LRPDSAGTSKAFLAHIRGLREQGIRSFFSIGVAITEPIRTAIVAGARAGRSVGEFGDLGPALVPSGRRPALRR
jgi:hypothetical protein